MMLLLWILIQIIGESLPISSSGHVALMQCFFSAQHFENAWVIDFLLHAPTVVILLIYFFPVWWRMIFPSRCPRENEDPDNKIMSCSLQNILKGLSLNYWILDRCRGRQGKSAILKQLLPPTLFIIIADIITFSFWLLNLSSIPVIANYFLPIGFCITAICLYFSRYGKFNKAVTWSISDAIFLGIVQGLCLLPGISRFASTYAVGIWIGYNRKNAFAVSFLIQMPLLCAAFAKGFIAVFGKHELLHIFMQGSVIFTFIIASLISYKLFCWVARLIEQNRLWYFAFYMMIPIFISLWIVKDIVS